MKNHKPDPDQESTSSFSGVADRLTNKLIKIMTNTYEQSSSESVNAMRTYYSSCLDLNALEKRGLEPLEDLLESIGGWPILSIAETFPDELFWFDGATSSIENLVSISELGLNLFVDVSVHQDPKNSTRHIIQLEQPSSFGLGRLSLANMTSAKKEVSAYMKFIEDSAKILGNSSIFNETEVLEEINDLVTLEAQIARNVVPDKNRHNATELDRQLTIAQLQKESPAVNWLNLVKRMFRNVKKVKITYTTVVVAAGLPFFKKLTDILTATSPRIISNYMAWRVVQSYGPLTTNSFRQAEFEYNKVISGLQKIKPRNETCSALAKATFSYAAASEYGVTYFPTKDRIPIAEMIGDIQSAFKDNLQNLKWMDDATKKLAAAKSENIVKFVGYPDWVLDHSALDAYYAKLTPFISNETFFEDYAAGENYTRSWNLNQITKAVNRNDWVDPTINPLDVSAKYMPQDNSIHIFAGIIDSPFYVVGRPNYMNYGGIGFVAGHELTHGFDDSGRQYDKDGNLVNWWSKETLNKFTVKTKCLIDEYSGYVDPKTKMHLDGKNTIGENIADNGGIKEALTAYRMWLTKHGEEKKLPHFEEFSSTQMFFLSHAYAFCANYRPEAMKNMIQYNVHSPPRFRVLGPDMNYVEFSSAWNCAVNTTMNPSDRCTIW